MEDDEQDPLKEEILKLKVYTKNIIEREFNSSNPVIIGITKKLSEAQRIKEGMKRIEGENIQLNLKIVDLEEEAKKSELTKRKLKEVMSEKDKLKNSLAQEKKINQKLTKKVTEDFNGYKTELKLLQAQKNEAQNENTRIEKEKLDMKIDSKILKKEAKDSKVIQEKLKKDLTEEKISHQHLTKKVAEDFKGYQAQIMLIQTQKEGLETDFAKQEKDRREQVKQHEQMINSLRLKNEELKNSMNKSFEAASTQRTEEFKRYQSQLTLIETQKAGLESKLTEKIKESENRDEKIKELELQNKELELQNKELELQNKELELQNKELELQNKELDLQNKELELQNKELELQNKELEPQNKELELQNKELERRLQESLDRASILRACHRKNIKKQNIAQQKLKTVNSSNDKLKQQLTETITTSQALEQAGIYIMQHAMGGGGEERGKNGGKHDKGYTGRPIYYRKYILKITQPP